MKNELKDEYYWQVILGYLLGLILLFLNDWMRKYQYANWITGKLS